MNPWSANYKSTIDRIWAYGAGNTDPGCEGRLLGHTNPGKAESTGNIGTARLPDFLTDSMTNNSHLDSVMKRSSRLPLNCVEIRLPNQLLKGLCLDKKCLHFFSDSKAYHEQMGPNTQFKWKLRYSPIQCVYLEHSAAHFSDHQRNRRCSN